MTDTEFDTKFDYYETVREELGLSAIWSIYEIENLSDRHPYEGVKFLTYTDFSDVNKYPIEKELRFMIYDLRIKNIRLICD